MKRLSIALGLLALTGCNEPSKGYVSDREAEANRRLPPGCKLTYVWMPYSPDLYVVQCDGRNELA